jgi:hypothetical protein
VRESRMGRASTRELSMKIKSNVKAGGITLTGAD